MADLSVEDARAIVEVGIEHHAWDEAVPAHDADIIKAAKDLITVSTTVAEQGKRPPIIKEILFIAKQDPVYTEVCKEKGLEPEQRSTEPQPSGVSTDAFAQAGGEAAPDVQHEFDINEIIADYDDLKVKDIVEKMKGLAADQIGLVKAYEAKDGERKGIMSFEPPAPPPPAPEAPQQTDVSSGDEMPLQQLYESGKIGVQTAIREGMAPPPEVKGDYPDVLTIDITTISPQDLTRLTMQYHTRLARALLLSSREEGKASVAENLKHDAKADAFAAAFSRLREAIEKPSASATTEARQEASREAEQDKTYRLWRDRQTAHEAEERTLKAMANGYEDAIDRISREQSRREKIAQS